MTSAPCGLQHHHGARLELDCREPRQRIAEPRDPTLHEIGSPQAIPIKLDVPGLGHGQHPMAIRHSLVKRPTHVGDLLIDIHLAAGEAETALAAEGHPCLFQAVRAQLRRRARLQGATTEPFVDNGLHMALLVARLVRLERLPVIAEDLLAAVFVDSLPCGCHSARLYHVLAAEASRLFTLLSPSRPIAAPGGAGRRGDLEKGNSYTLKVPVTIETSSALIHETFTEP
jgi:hypothetical protein